MQREGGGVNVSGYNSVPLEEAAIHLDVDGSSFKSKPASIFLPFGVVSDAYENTRYEHDLVLLFPRRQGGERHDLEAFTMQTFVTLLLGGTSTDTFYQRVLRTSRCFLDNAGNDMVESRHRQPQRDGVEALSKDERERLVLEEEYATFTGSSGPTTELCFCELIATAISRRVQLACGLTTRMFVSCEQQTVR